MVERVAFAPLRRRHAEPLLAAGFFDGALAYYDAHHPEFALAEVSMGNPHAVIRHDDPDAVVATVGPLVENSPRFPDRTNVEFIRRDGPGEITMRVWERGAGLTRACGTGACATAVAAIRRGLVKSPVRVTLPGGDLTIAWGPGGSIIMSGPATTSFTGTFDWDDYAAGAAR